MKFFLNPWKLRKSLVSAIAESEKLRVELANSYNQELSLKSSLISQINIVESTTKELERANEQKIAALLARIKTLEMELETSKAETARCSAQLSKAEWDLAKEQSYHSSTKTGMVKLLEWVHTTHRLSSVPQGIRALFSAPNMVAIWFLIAFSVTAQPAPVLRNSWSTNLPGTTVQGLNNLSVTNLGSTTNWQFFNVGPKTVARLGDVTNIVSSATGGSQVWTNTLNLIYPIVASSTNTAKVLIATNGLIAIGDGLTNFYGGPLANYPFLLVKDSDFGSDGMDMMVSSIGAGNRFAEFDVFGNSQHYELHVRQSSNNVDSTVYILASEHDAEVYSTVDGSVMFDLWPGQSDAANTIYDFNTKSRVDASGKLLSVRNNGTERFAVGNLGTLSFGGVTYSPPTLQGASKSVWTNDGSGNLGWWIPLFQPASANLTNWSNIPTGAMANIVSVTFLTNWANAVSNYVTSATNSAVVTNWVVFRQPASANLTNWSLLSTGDFANVVSTTFLTNWANSVSNYVTASTNSSQVTNWVVFRQPASANLTNWSLIPTGVMANVVATTFLTNWANSISNLTQTKTSLTTNADQFGPSVQLTIANGALFTNMNYRGSGTNRGMLLVDSNLLVKAGGGTSNAFVGGSIYFDLTSNYTNLNGTATTFTNLATNAIPAHTLTNNGDSVICEWGGKFADALASTNNFKVLYGSATLIDTGLQIASNCPWASKVRITRTGNTEQLIQGTFLWGPGGAVPFPYTNVNFLTTQTNGILTSIALQGASRRVGAITNNYFRIYFEPASR